MICTYSDFVYQVFVFLVSCTLFLCSIGFLIMVISYAYDKFTGRKIVKRKVQRAHKRELL